MEKSTNSGELQCVGRLEIVRPKPVGFLCGSIPVPTDKSFHAFNSALVPSSQTVSAPRYRMLPTETDLNTPPLLSSLPDRVLPIDYGAAVQSRAANGGVPWDSGTVSSNLIRKGEALAVSGLVDYGDEIDVIAPADIVKQIFKMPYSKARLSIAVHRIGQTLVLNAGPDVEEGERLVRRNQPKCADQSLFLNFAMHSVRMEACDCPPAHSPKESRPKSSVLPDPSDSMKDSFTSSDISRNDATHTKGLNQDVDKSEVKQECFYWESTKNKRNKGHSPVKKASQIGGKARCSMQESEKYGRGGNDEFLRVLFWQFHNFRMLLGSDLLLFSNEKYVAVSLHLWDVSRQVTPLTWLEAWLDNIMASVPELAICYHQNGVVQGYELLKTNDIFLLKGISEDGTPAFHPYVVQKNGLSVLRFLQENCKEDPGAYWLYKSVGEDVIQLFDLSAIPQNHPPDNYDNCSSSLPSLLRKGRTGSLLSLGTLLYRIAHRLSLSMAPANRARCARFFRKCFELLDEPDHLVIRAFAHEQFARLILNNSEELELTTEASSPVSEVTVMDAEEESLDIISSMSASTISELSSVEEEGPCKDLNKIQDSADAAFGDNLETDASESRSLIEGSVAEFESKGGCVPICKEDISFAVCNASSTPARVIQTIADPISSKLAAVHHVSQAIKSFRWMRQLQASDQELVDHDDETILTTSTTGFSLCTCGEADCIEVCDIREWLPTLKLDHKLWKLVLLLGESYLALGEAYKEDDQLLQALKVVEVACSVYGSVPQHLEDARFISSMISSSACQTRINDGCKKKRSVIADETRLKSSCCDDYATLEHSSSIYLFWFKAWTLVGDVYAEFYMKQDKEVSTQLKQKPSGKELKMSSDVVKELIRLKKKLSQDKENCSSCSLVNCSCQGDRASSGNSASSSSGDACTSIHSRRQSKKSSAKSAAASLARNLGDDSGPSKGPSGMSSASGHMGHKRDGDTFMEESMTFVEDCEEKSSDSTTMGGAKVGLDMPGIGSPVVSLTETASSEQPKSRSGGIFKYLHGPVSMDGDEILSAALSCYEQARKALGGILLGSKERESVLKKIGWVCNELGRHRLNKKDLAKAEIAFTCAIDAFREVSDHTNIILINCNLGHGRRALAEELVLKVDYLKTNAIFHTAYKQALEAVKVEYARSLRFYGAAKSELGVIVDGADDVATGLKNEVFTQLAHTYLRLGMLLGREDTIAEFYEFGASDDDTSIGFHGTVDKRAKKEQKKHDITANDAIREALSIYESLGELRKQEAAFAHFQLACYQRDCCLKFLDPNHGSSYSSKAENNILQRVKQYASLAERNWLKAIEFYNANTHPTMYLTIQVERSSLSFALSSSFHSHAMLETALSCLLEVRHISKEPHSDSIRGDNPEIYAKFWSQLQMLLKMMLASALSPSPSKSGFTSLSTPSSKRSGEADKLRELYKMSLKCIEFSQLHAMHNLWTS